MIIAIWVIGIMLLWMFNMLSFNVKGYWTISTYIPWCVIFTAVLTIVGVLL